MRKEKFLISWLAAMVSRKHTQLFSFPPFLQVLSVCICVHLCLLPSGVRAQGDAAQEVAVNLAEGRVVICAAKDGIIVATADEHTEPGSRQPVVVTLSALRAGVLLGAVEWIQPESSDKPIRLDGELERVREVAGQLHHKINLGEDEPLLRLVLVDYVPDYGPEAWLIDYHIHQDALASDYWRTRVLRPSYKQLYPPEKGQPHTLIEVRYPPANRAAAAPELLDLLRQNDPRLAQ